MKALSITIQILFYSLFATLTFSQTTISQNINTNTTWTATGSPYLITDRIFVDEDITLTIQPGTIVKFENGVRFHIRGIINALGNSNNPIIFTSLKDDSHGGDSNNDGNTTTPTKDDWNYMSIEPEGTGSFQDCQFFYGGGYFNSGGILRFHGNGSVKNCHFDNVDFGIGPAISFLSNPILENLSFGLNAYDGIGLLSNSEKNINFTLGKYESYPYLVNDDLWIRETTELTILPGTVFKLYDGAEIEVSGKLLAIGTENEKIIFTSINDDNHKGDTNKDGLATQPKSSDWEAIIINGTGQGDFDYCEFTYGGTFGFYGILKFYGLGRVVNCHFDNNYEGIGPAVYFSTNPIIENNSYGPSTFEGVGWLTSFSTSLSGDYTLAKYSVPTLVPYNISVHNSINLIIQPGTVIKTLSTETITIDGNLTAVGTSSQPIVFTSILDDNFGGDSNHDGAATLPSKQDWGGIQVSSGGSGNFEECYFLYSGNSHNSIGALQILNNNTTVTNCHFYENAVPIRLGLGFHPTLEGLDLRNNRFNAIGLKEPSSSTSGNHTISPYENYPYCIVWSLDLPENYNLTIAPGTIFKTNGWTMAVEGSVKALGTEEHPIIFTYISDDEIGGDTNSDGADTKPTPYINHGAIVSIDSDLKSEFKNCQFKYGGNERFSGLHRLESGALNLEKGEIEVDSCLFIGNANSIFARENTKATFNYCQFTKNRRGFSSADGTFLFRNCLFEKNEEEGVINYGSTEIDAQYNEWGIENLQQLVNYTNGSNLNLESIYDELDDTDFGKVNIDNPILTEGISQVSPSSAILLQESITMTIDGYQFSVNDQIFLCRPMAANIYPTATNFINQFEWQADFDIGIQEPGIYDVCVLKPNGDTLTLERGFIIADSDPVAFNEWIPFEVTNGNAYAGNVLVPNVNDLFVLVKKTTHLGYSSTWTGGLRFALGPDLVSEEESFETTYGGGRSDIDLHIEDPTGGLYSFEMETNNASGEGQIMFTDELPELTLGEWDKGTIYRPYGYDWKQVEVPSGQDTLHIKTNGFGKWSTIEVYYEGIGGTAPYWKFDNWGRGYEIEAKIPSPARGTYYIRYKDSAVLLSQNKYSADGVIDQEREYLIHVNTNPIVTEGEFDLEVTGLSVDTVGQGLVTFDVYGQGFKEGDLIKLMKNNEELLPDSKILDVKTGQSWTVTFDFSNTTVGNWDIIVENELSTKSVVSAITIKSTSSPLISVKVIAQSQIRTGRWTPFIVEIENTGNVDAFGIFVTIELDTSAKIKYDSNYFDVPYNLEKKISKDYLKEMNDEWNEWDDVSYFIDVKNNNQYTRLLPLIIYRIDAGATERIELEIKYDKLIDYKFDVKVQNPLFSGEDIKSKSRLASCNIWFADCSEEILETAADALIESIQNEALSCVGSVVNLFETSITDGKNLFFGSSGKVRSLLKVSHSILSSVYDCSALFPPRAAQSLLLKSLEGLHTGISTFNDGLDRGLSCLEKCEEEKRGSNSKNQGTTVGSSTPEDKYGISGVEKHPNLPPAQKQNYVQEQDFFNYRIDYWNDEDATAPAVEVFIRDTLDENFDINTFEFTEVGFLRWKEQVSGQYFNIQIDMRPDFNLIVNIEGSVDEQTREVYWVHRAVDPTTFDLPYDPLAGFLPPIDPEGYNLGYVNYQVKPKNDMPEGTAFKNQAFVNFDGVGKWGKAPPYGPWTNTYDLTAPTSFVRPEILECDTEVKLILSGEDNDGSGVERYTIYYSKDNGPFEILGDTTANVYTMAGEAGETYRFYSLATDKVGNRESDKSTADPHASITVTGGSNDTDAPYVTCDSWEVALNPSGTVSLLETINSEDLVVDNCSESDNIALILSQQTFSCDDAGFTRTLTIQATDETGNQSVCNVSVSVIDPHAVCSCTVIATDTLVNDILIPSGTYNITNTIEAIGQIVETANVVFRAGQSITLKPGFEVKNGGDFLALIGSCPDSPDNVLSSDPSTISRESYTNQPEFNTPLYTKTEQVISPNLKIYPNPFNAQTTIAYELHQDTDVSIRVIGLNGQVIQELLNTTNQTKGKHQLTFDGSTLDGGLYLVQLRTADTVVTKKVTLIN